MNKSELFKAAHNLAKSVIKAGDNYRVTFGAAIKAVLSGFTAAKTFVIEWTNRMTCTDYKEEIVANSAKEAVEKFEKEYRVRPLFISEKPAQEIKEAKYVEDAEAILFEMECKGVDSMKFKAHNRSRAITVTRKECEDYINYKNAMAQVKRMTWRQVMA